MKQLHSKQNKYKVTKKVFEVTFLSHFDSHIWIKLS